MTAITHGSTGTIKAEQMRDIAEKNPTSHGLLLFFALDPTLTKELEVPTIKKELKDRGVPVSETSLYDALQELEELGLGVIIWAKKDNGEDKFKRDYNLTRFAGRAFKADYLNDWKQRFDQEHESKIQLVDRRIHFQEPLEERRKSQKEAVGKAGRPKGYSHKLGRFMTKEELAAREFKMTHKNPRGRPAGWKKPGAEPRALSTKVKTTLTKVIKEKKYAHRGRPANYSLKLGRYFTPAELKQRELQKNVKKKVGRPVGWRKKPEDRVTPVRPTPKATLNMGNKAPVAGEVFNLALGGNRSIYMVIPKRFTKDDLALLNLNLEHFVKNN